MTWKIVHGELPMGAYLNDLKTGLATNCDFCGLEMESANHINCQCTKIQLCWTNVLNSLDWAFICKGYDCCLCVAHLEG